MVEKHNQRANVGSTESDHVAETLRPSGESTRLTWAKDCGRGWMVLTAAKVSVSGCALACEVGSQRFGLGIFAMVGWDPISAKFFGRGGFV